MTSSDAPQPPGGPLREDEPDGPMAPAGQPHGTQQDQTQQDQTQQDEAQRALQEENAGTSLDEPSQ